MKYEIDKAEVRRYLGINGVADDLTEALIDECSSHLLKTVKPQYIYRTFSINTTDKGYYIKECDLHLNGKTAHDYLCGSEKITLLGATLGIEADNLIRISQSTNMTKAVIYNACATDLIEKVCDYAQSEIRQELAFQNLIMADRFSPGYGDLPLALQKDICNILNINRSIGVYLTNELLLLPTKSVTAFIGSGTSIQNKEHHNCNNCNMKDKCIYKNL